jgi:serine/threonine protein kinase HipA of HipAB toxin-antitoxin module
VDENEVSNGRVPWFGPFGAQLKRILQGRASKIPFELIAQLLENERIHLDTPEGSQEVLQGLDRILSKDWRDPTVVIEERSYRQIACRMPSIRGEKKNRGLAAYPSKENFGMKRILVRKGKLDG